MLLPAVLLAAVQAVSPPSLAEHVAQGGRVTVYASRDEALAAMRARAACRESGLQLVDQPAAPRSKVKPLGDLPPANHTLTVLRSVDGCPVSSTVRFNVDGRPRR